MRIAAFFSHPIPYFTPLWQELSQRPGVTLRVHYFSRRALDRGILDALRDGWDAVLIHGDAHANNAIVTLACAQLGIPVLLWADNNLHGERAKPGWKLAVKRRVLSVYLRGVRAILATGGATRAYFEYYGFSSKSIFIAPYAVDVARFRHVVRTATPGQIAELRARWRIPVNRRIVMFCGKLAPRKRPFDVLAAVRRLSRQSALAVFVGDGELRGELERAAGECAVVVGFVNQSEVPLALSFADVLVLSSDFEPYGMVVAEAQALGVPAIVSDACGCHGVESVLLDGVSGFVYPAGDVSALADRLGRVLGDDKLRMRMQLAARIQSETQSAVAAANGVLAAVRFVTR